MSKTVSTGYTDTTLSPDTSASLTLLRGPVNTGIDFAVQSNKPGEVVLVNITSPADRVEKFRFGFTDVADIYKGSGIDPAYYGPSRKGVSVVVQLTEVQRISDSIDVKYNVDLPISCHLVIKVPSNEFITAAVVETAIKRMLSGLYPKGATTLTRLTSLLRGSLVPPEL